MRVWLLMSDYVTVLVRLVCRSEVLRTGEVVGQHWWRWMLLVVIAGAAVMGQHAAVSRLLLQLMLLGVGYRIRIVAVLMLMLMMMMGDGYGGAACVRGVVDGLHKCRCCRCVGSCVDGVGIDAGAAVRLLLQLVVMMVWVVVLLVLLLSSWLRRCRAGHASAAAAADDVPPL